LVVKGIMSLEAQVIEAQKNTKAGGEAFERLKQMAAKETISASLVKEMERDLETNFKDLDRVLAEVGQGLKRIKVIQNKFGAKKDTDYLDVTINVNDIDRLTEVYDFVDGITIEDTKRFCVAYNLKSGLISNIYDRARKKDPMLSKDFLAHFTSKNIALFTEKRYMSLPLRTAIMTNAMDIFEAEVQLLNHTLNLVKALDIRKKASYQSVMAMLEQAKNGDRQMVKSMGLLWGRIQTRMFKFQPVNHVKNFEGNRQAMLTDVNESYGSFLKR